MAEMRTDVRTEMRAETQAQATTPQEAPAAPGPFNADQAGPTLFMVLVAILSGLMNFYHKVKSGHARWLNLTELVGELFTSAVCGLVAYWTLKGLSVNEWLTAAGVGIVGHMGSRALFMAEEWGSRWIEKNFSLSAPATKPEPEPEPNNSEGRPHG